MTILNYLSVRFLRQLLLGNFKFCHAMPHRSIATCSMQLVRSTNSRFKRCWYSCTVYYYCPTRQFMMDAPSTNMQPKRGHDDGADFLASCILRLHEPLPKLSRKHRIVDQALRNADQLTEFIYAAFRRVAHTSSAVMSLLRQLSSARGSPPLGPRSRRVPRRTEGFIFVARRGVCEGGRWHGAAGGRAWDGDDP